MTQDEMRAFGALSSLISELVTRQIAVERILVRVQGIPEAQFNDERRDVAAHLMQNHDLATFRSQMSAERLEAVEKGLRALLNRR